MDIKTFMGFEINESDWNEVMLIIDKIEGFNYHGRYVVRLDSTLCQVYKGVKVVVTEFGKDRLSSALSAIRALLEDVSFNIDYRGGYITQELLEKLRNDNRSKQEDSPSNQE